MAAECISPYFIGRKAVTFSVPLVITSSIIMEHCDYHSFLQEKPSSLLETVDVLARLHQYMAWWRAL